MIAPVEIRTRRLFESLSTASGDDVFIPTFEDDPRREPPRRELMVDAAPDLLRLAEAGMLDTVRSPHDLTKYALPLARRASALYMIKDMARPLVVKFQNQGDLEGEARALQTWRELAGVACPEVYRTGVVPYTHDSVHPMRYIIMEGITDGSGNPAPHAQKFMDENPDMVEAIAESMGTMLAKMHSVVSDKPSDTREFYFGAMQRERPYFLSFGVTESQVQRLLSEIQQAPFPQFGSLIHCDYAAYNVLLDKGDPAKLRPIDPQPAYGEPYHDVVYFLNGVERTEAGVLEDPDNTALLRSSRTERKFVDAVMNAYQSTAAVTFDERRLLLVQIIKETRLTHFDENVRGFPDEVLAIDLRKRLLRERISRLVGS
jgi:aminoglycoside phosphotransferase (APT) family kinase protein